MDSTFFIESIPHDNAAFDDGNCPNEIARILRDIADKVEAGAIAGTTCDINGNRLGEWGFN